MLPTPKASRRVVEVAAVEIVLSAVARVVEGHRVDIHPQLSGGRVLDAHGKPSVSGT